MSRVILPVDRLEELWRPGKVRVGALLHGASVNARLESTLTILERLQAVGMMELRALFGPQHGFLATTQDNMVEWKGYQHPRLGIPVYSLYGQDREPTLEMLEAIDVLLVDLVDVGARYYTFIWTLFLCMKACERAGVRVVVCDRPNPLGGLAVEGVSQREEYFSFVGLWPLANRHGKTIGEVAQMFQREVFPRCDLEVLPMRGWERSMWYDETGLPWVMPSPNMPTLDAATVYPGMCLLEGTNVSEGRGTTRPFEMIGAPWVDGEDLAEALNDRALQGVRFRPCSFEPTFQKHARRVCHGVQVHVCDRARFESVLTGTVVIQVLWREYDEFRWKVPPYEYETEKLPIEILVGRSVEEFFGHRGDVRCSFDDLAEN
ncbi:MAG: DUF1343 domain-containing protein [Verrucomicrobiota bacterium]